MKIVGIGNALVDVIAFVDESYAPRLGFHNNAVVHLERPRLDRVLDQLGVGKGADPSPHAGRRAASAEDGPEVSVSAGGGTSNTIRAVAYLGAETSFAGMIGDDDLGALFEREMREAGVRARLSRSDAPTGVFCSLIRPDGGRTLLVSPSAALDISLESLPDELFVPGAIFYAECFLLRDRAFLMDCIGRARAAGMEIVLDLASRDATAANRDFLLAMLPECCDLVFANEDEFVALAGLPLREGLELFSAWDIEMVVKRAELGALWARGGRFVSSPALERRPVDETGAGDAFAAGFLYGRSEGLPPERCLRLGNRVAEQALAVAGFGVDPERIRSAVEGLLTV